MNTKKVLRKIHDEINAFNESGGREDKACAEGLRRARQIIQIESLKAKVLNENQQVVFEQLCLIYDKQIYKSKMQAIYIFINEGMSEEFLMLDKKESDQVLASFAEWGMKDEQ